MFPRARSFEFLRTIFSDIRCVYLYYIPYMCVMAGMCRENFRYYVFRVPRANGSCHARMKFSGVIEPIEK